MIRGFLPRPGPGLANRDFDTWATVAITRRDLLTLGAGDGEGHTPTTALEREFFGNSIRSIQAA